MDVAASYSGRGLPLTLAAACGPLFEPGCVALMMAAGSTRAAAHLLSESAPEDLAEEWVPKLLGGEWSRRSAFRRRMLARTSDGSAPGRSAGTGSGDHQSEDLDLVWRSRHERAHRTLPPGPDE
ncbi:hypothetical protein MUU54_14505 [Rhizobium tarimense]|nr:hypothetical protein [Pseudorhizobium tarimense]MCJ8520021.1 hypothetical protein [Pseudorhizobium tarimense]